MLRRGRHNGGMSTTHQQTISAGTTAFQQGVRLSCTASRVATDGKCTAGRRRIAREAFAAALRDLISHEDRGVDTAWVADQVTSARQAAQRVGLLTPEDVSRIESEACAA